MIDQSSMIDKIKSERSRKIAALGKLFLFVPKGEEAMRKREGYLEACSRIEVAAFEAACEDLGDSWTDKYGPPQPGHIREAARRYQAKSRAEIETEQRHQRHEYDKKNAMTLDSIRAELERVRDVDLPEDEFECRVEVLRRESLQRIIDRAEGRIPPGPRVRQRGEGGLQKINFDEIL